VRISGLLIAIALGLIAMAFLLAFTVFGEVSAVAGVGLVIIGAAMNGRRPSPNVASQPGEALTEFVGRPQWRHDP
jgi:hypothetical protein